MELKPLLLAAMLTVSSSAFADNYTAPTRTLGGGPLIWITTPAAGIGTLHRPGPFTDTYTFNYSGDPGLASIGFSGLSFLDHHINFTSATLNGISIPTRNAGLNASAYATALPVSGLLTLIIHGYTLSPTGYTGMLNVVISAVPEPASDAMLLGGLTLLGMLARRRRAA
ncbi:FxDxF family PEP-CTERM protein [Janthinobacterium agaricidamnosum]|uniref:PEP-CTERM putative exosortase interaction domain protein n=1 Tax=Janthinobacterium agaricidamnosum NBRC 102515 = DSM 9628 TaxID=1349767 RepID=W0VD36_9BURK|nr:FxDxF family PEP-CTERM protein [Janthinobacterium agaricidamnosum]CDG85565.1 PEP-CTERM putative exosortase interaction domain protein [Janthinobacterium agaricidamnosum NBRC 102515 = DSM 9628]